MKKVRVIYIASGICAPSEAVRDRMWETINYAEIDPYAIEYYKARNKENKGGNLGDISKLTDEQIRGIGEYDCAVASLPCQSFSISGNRKGFEDARGNLFYDFLRIIKITRPNYLVMENVKGLVNHDKGKTLTTIEAELEKLDYQIEWNILNSKDHSVPQNRERVYLIGRHSRTKPRGAFFPVGESNRQDTRRVGEDLSYCLDANYHKGTNTTLKGRRQLIQVNTPVHSNNRVYDPEGLAPTLRDMSLGGNRQPFILTERRTEESKRIRREHKAKTGKDFSPRRGKEIVPRMDGLVGTLTTSPTIEQTLVDEQARVRRLTPLECWRLQGFPDECYHLANSIGLSNTRQYKALGNAITVPVFSAIAKRLEQIMD